jgi:D-lactate dehydrogenase
LLPAPDRALVDALGRVMAPDRVLTRPLDRLGRSVDASIYRLIPEVVVRPRGVPEIQALLATAHAHGRHLTFRTAGTSLSGQAVTDGILVELAPYWTQASVASDGASVTCQPGVIGGYLNRLLLPFARRLGPDPASIDAAMMGGILANNSSGMCCGVEQNSYHTLRALDFVLADGTRVDTAQPDADARLREARPGLHGALLALRDEVRADAVLAARIRDRFARKNTTGYSLNALLDFETPAEILAHLMVGSQGTLGFVAGMTLATVPDPPYRATALVFFPELHAAGAAVAPLVEAGAAALEIMDAASLRSQAAERVYPFPLGAGTAALLVEMRAATPDELAAQVESATRALHGATLLAPLSFGTDPAERAAHWHLRKGLFPAVGGARRAGTAVLIEDVAVPVPRLADAILDLQQLFGEHGFPEAVVFGHARDGNLHVVFAEDFGSPEALARYGAFMRGLVDLVVGKYDGALKAEHGSGRNMAPFVREEFGARAHDVMRRVKELLDPDGILNPGVILTRDPETHLKHLKPLPSISPTADRCIECGFCEPRCPSRQLTLTPRQRIVVTRERARLRALGTAEARTLERSLADDFDYEGIATCVGDSMCQTTCPVHIDTGALMKELRRVEHAPLVRRLASAAARHYGLVVRGARLGLRMTRSVRAWPGGAAAVDRGSAMLHRMAPAFVPRLTPQLVLPLPAPSLPPLPATAGEPVVYFPSCLTRMLGALPGEPADPLAEAMVEVLGRAGFAVRYPPGVGGLCCGMPFGSKALDEAAAGAAARTAQALWQASDDGRVPVVTDASPCAGVLRDKVAETLRKEGRALRMLDFPSFWREHGLDRVAAGRREGVAVLHPTCTLVKMGGMPDLLAVASAYAESVVVPAAAECCGFAGDRGFLVPEVTANATAAEAAEVRARAGAEAGLYSTCRTCEIGMTRAVGRRYASIVHLVRDGLRRAV